MYIYIYIYLYIKKMDFHEICREMRSSDVNTGSQPRGPLSGRRVPMAVAGAGHRP